MHEVLKKCAPGLSQFSSFDKPYLSLFIFHLGLYQVRKCNNLLALGLGVPSRPFHYLRIFRPFKSTFL